MCHKKVWMCLSLAWCVLSGMSGVTAAPIGVIMPKPAAPVEAAYRRGLDSLAKGEWREAEAAFKEAVQLEPRAVPPLLGLADIALKQGNLKQVDNYLQQALIAAPHSMAVQAAWGRYLYLQKRFPEAETAFKKAIAFDPKAVLPHLDLGDLYLSGWRRPKDAIESYRAALALDQSHAGAHYKLGQALATNGDFEAAQKELTEAYLLAPNDPLPLQALGQMYVIRQDYEKALKAFTEALQVQPQFVQAYLARGDVYLIQGHIDKAVGEYQAALRVAPTFAPAYVQLGMLYEGMRRVDDAEKAYLAAIEYDTNQSIAYNNLAWLAAERRTRLDEALTWAKRAVELEPKVPQFQDTLGWVHRARGELERAMAVLQKAASMEPQQAVLWYHLALVYSERKRPKDTLAALRQALKLQQDFPGIEEAKRRLAELEKKP